MQAYTTKLKGKFMAKDRLKFLKANEQSVPSSEQENSSQSEVSSENKESSSSVEESDFTKKITAPTELGDHRTALFSVIDILEKNHIIFKISREPYRTPFV